MSTYSRSPSLPAAGHRTDDPLATEIREETSVPNPRAANPDVDMELTRTNEVENGGDMDSGANSDDEAHFDAESVLSEVDEAQFEDFDLDPALADRPAIAVDESNVGLIGVHKRKRVEGEEEPRPKKKKEGRREKPKKNRRRRRDGSEPFSGGEEIEGKRVRKPRGEAAEPRPRQRRAAIVEDDETLTPEESMSWAISLGHVHANLDQDVNARSIERWMKHSKILTRGDANMLELYV